MTHLYTSHSSSDLTAGTEPLCLAETPPVPWGHLRSTGSAYRPDPEPANLPVDVSRTVPYRDAVCGLCERAVAMAFAIPLETLRAPTRCGAEIALARQVAMYLSHTIFSLMLTEIGLHFRRDRTTVSYACALVEDRRDDFEFDLLLCEVEAMLIEARNAMAFSLSELIFHAHRHPQAGMTAEDELHDALQRRRRNCSGRRRSERRHQRPGDDWLEALADQHSSSPSTPLLTGRGGRNDG